MTLPTLDCIEIALLQQLNRKFLNSIPPVFVETGLAKHLSKGYTITNYGKKVLKANLPYCPSRTLMSVPSTISTQLYKAYKNNIR